MEVKKSYLLGIIGALLGGLIASIPWILMYVYANMIYSLLAILVAIGALKGYELFNGKVDKKLPWIIALISILCITIATLVIIPNLLLLKEYGTLSFVNFKLLYSNKEFTNALMADYVLSLVFTFLGISGVVSTIKKQVNNGIEKINLNYEESLMTEELNNVKETFTKLNALNKENAISKETLDSNISLEDIELKYLIQKGIIKIYKNNYYYIGTNKKNKNKSWLITIIVIIILFTIGILASNLGNKTNKEDNSNNRVITYSIPNTYQEYDYNENGDIGWFYVPKKDLSGESAGIYVFYYESEENDENETLSLLEDVLKEDKYYVSSNIYKSDKGYQTLEVELDNGKYIDYIYYVFNGNKYAFVNGYKYNVDNNGEIKETSKEVANTLTWK